MIDDLYRGSRGVLMTHGVIASTPSRLPGIFSFLLTGALFAAILILTFSQASAAMIYIAAAYALKYSPVIIVAVVATLVWFTR